jgi:SAM-dependent methyltransferase
MSVFGNYARYYDLLYADKDYAGETEYIVSLLSRYAPDAASILELGCGTGIHASLLAREYEVRGIDLSDEMLESAKQRNASLSADVAARISFASGDVRSYRAGRSFDAVISLFHVMSYQTTPDDLRAAFETASSHLNESGIFIFDCWYGPAVLTDRPVVRVKRLEDKSIRIVRVAEPTMHPNENCVDVDYQVFIADKLKETIDELREKHTMRYLFLPEIEYLLAGQGMKLIGAEEWMTGKKPGYDTWGVCCIARKET